MIETCRYTLPNGLRVIHNYEPSTVMVAVDVLYDTGSRDESRDLTGIAHLFEHLMFGGSVNIPDFDRELEDAGGENNAWTSNDFTNFYDVVPAQNVETVFHLESDRMLGLAFSRRALDVQRRVVIEEFKQQCLNRPYGDMMHALRAALYQPDHPYSWPVIGLTPEHIERVTDDDIHRWFYARYAPDNAVLAISGNLPCDRGRQLVEKWFGDIPARHPGVRVMPDPGFPDTDRTVTVEGPVPHPLIVIAIPMDPYGTHDYRVADCITDLLAAGRSTRLYRHLVADGDGSIIEADASIAGAEGPGFVMLNARPASADPDTLDRVEAALLGELRRLATPGDVSAHELERAFNRFESTFALSNYDALSKAQNLALAEIHGEDINDTVALQRTVTLGDIARVAGILASRPHVTLRYLPRQ
ncbi:MAG: pitrilysin family protein [Bacteroidales bacterium]|nr:pitrilysin family protein [Bacteroidales bacterium]